MIVGNMLDQGSCPTGSNPHAYTYNAENQLTLTAGVNYIYDGDGNRVEKYMPSANPPFYELYWYGGGTAPLEETDGTGSTAATNTAFHEYVFFGGKRIARRDGTTTGDPQFYLADQLGSARVVTNATGGTLSDIDYCPYGAQCYVASDTSGNNYKFTGKERDIESGLDNFGARYNASSMARSMSPDPSPMGIAMADPQSWNLYSYVRNRPTRSVDIRGNWATDVHVEITTFALQGYVSAGELAELNREQYVMDKDQSDQHKHFMQNPKGDTPQGALNGAMIFVNENTDRAADEVAKVGHLDKNALDALGDATHTLQDMTSPMHTDMNFYPMVWEGGYWPPSKWGPGLNHVAGEGSPNNDWFRIGIAVRLTMMTYMKVDPEGAASHGLTAGTFNSEANRRIQEYVDWIYSGMDAGQRANYIQEDAARLCALGNPAACNP